MADYEHCIIWLTKEIDLVALTSHGGIADFMARMDDLARSLDEQQATAKGGGWDEVVSHDFCLVGSLMLASFVVRRPRVGADANLA